MIREEEEELTEDSIEQNEAISELIRRNIEMLTKSIKEDTNNLTTWILGEDQTTHKCKKGDTESFPESIKFQMISLNINPSLVTYRIIVLQNRTVDIETLIKWVKVYENMLTVCSEDDKRTLTDWISENQQTITESIIKDTTKFTDMIKGLNDTLDEKTKHDIKILTETKGLSPSNTYRNYDIVLSKTSNEKSSNKLIQHDTGARALFEPGCPSALDITLTKVELKWEEPSIGTDFIHFYQIICEEQRTSVTYFFETPGNSCTFVEESLKPKTEYEFIIQAIKNRGNKGTISQTFTVSTSEITFDQTAELLYVLFYITVLIWFMNLFCYTVTTT